MCCLKLSIHPSWEADSLPFQSQSLLSGQLSQNGSTPGVDSNKDDPWDAKATNGNFMDTVVEPHTYDAEDLRYDLSPPRPGSGTAPTNRNHWDT